MTFGDILKKIRIEAGITQEDLGIAIGKNRSSVAGYEALGKMPEFDTFIKIADYFGVSTDYLLGRSETKYIEGSIEKSADKKIIDAMNTDPVYREIFCFISDMQPDMANKLLQVAKII